MDSVVNNIDENYGYAKSNLDYPYVLIKDADDTLAVVMESLEPGDISVVVEYQGALHKLNVKISRSALTLNKLLRVYKFDLYLSENSTVHVTNILDVLDIDTWTV